MKRILTVKRQSFEKIRTGKDYYLDKTPLVKGLVKKGYIL